VSGDASGDALRALQDGMSEVQRHMGAPWRRYPFMRLLPARPPAASSAAPLDSKAVGASVLLPLTHAKQVGALSDGQSFAVAAGKLQTGSLGECMQWLARPKRNHELLWRETAAIQAPGWAPDLPRARRACGAGAPRCAATSC